MKNSVPTPLLLAIVLALLLASTALAAPLPQMRGGGGPGPGPGPGGGSSTTLTTAASADFSGSGNCAFCHSALRDSASNDVSIDSHWRSTMMANSARDVLWQGKVESEVARNPALKELIETKCATCHMPMARTQALTDGSPVQILGSGFLSSTNQLHPLAMDGTSCALCHQVQAGNLGTGESYSGHYSIDSSTSAPNRLIFGQYPNPMQQQMQMHVGYTPVQGKHVEDSALCGTCHTLFTPILDSAGNVVGEFPEQAPYLEWRHSSYGDGASPDQSCQGCHMPQAVGGVAISNRPMMLAPRQPFEQHFFVGGNVYLLRLLQANASALGLTASSSQFGATLARTVDLLRTRTGKLTIQQSQLGSDGLNLVLKVENLSGHKLPTGFPLRRSWVHLVVTDSKGQIVFESGRPLTDGRIVGNDADDNPTAVEPHYDLITSPSQVQIYESIMKNTDGAVTYTLLRGADYAKDNRLLPAGFNKATAGHDVAVHGQAASDANFVGGSDLLAYQVSTAGYRGPFTVTARLLFQPVSYRFAQDLVRDNVPLVQRFSQLIQGLDKSPAVIEEVTTTIK